METFPTPNLLPNLFQEMPEPGTRITEAEALRILRDLVRTIDALFGSVHKLLRQNAEDELYITLSDLTLQYLEPAQALLEAWYAVWYEQHGSPAARRRRKAAATEPPAPSAGVDEPTPSPPPASRRRPGRSQTPRTGEGV